MFDTPRARWLTAVAAASLVPALASCESAPSSTIPDDVDTCKYAKSGQICTYIGNGTKGWDGDGHSLLKSTLSTPWDVLTDEAGNLYITDWNNHRVRVAKAGKLQTVIGSYDPGDGDPEGEEFKPEGADGLTVALNHPTDMFFAQIDSPVAKKGQLVLTAWHNHRIRTFDPASGKVFVTCGKAPGYVGDGEMLGKHTSFNQPSHAIQDKAGNTYILDMRNWLVRKVAADKSVAKLAGKWGKPGGSEADEAAPVAATDAQFLFFDPAEWSNPYFAGGGLEVSDDGKKLYIADTGNHRIRFVDLDKNTVETIAGSGANGCVDVAGTATACANDQPYHPRAGEFAGDGGQAKAAKLNLPTDLAWGPDGRLYFADSGNDRVRAIDLKTGIISTFAGGGNGGTTGDVQHPLKADKLGDGGAASAASLNRPRGIHWDKAGNLWIADSYNNRIRKVVK